MLKKDPRALLKQAEASKAARDYRAALPLYFEASGILAADGFALKAILALKSAREVIRDHLPNDTIHDHEACVRLVALYRLLGLDSEARQIEITLGKTLN